MRRRISLFILILVCLSVLVTACGSTGGASTSPPELAPTSVPQTMPTNAPEPAPTSAPEPTPTAAEASAPTSAPEPTPIAAEASAPTGVSGEVQEFEITSDPDGYHPERITVKAGSQVRLIVTNIDSDLHDLYNRKVGIEVEFAPMTTATFDWVAPLEPGLYVAVCTYHDGLFIKFDVVK